MNRQNSFRNRTSLAQIYFRALNIFLLSLAALCAGLAPVHTAAAAIPPQPSFLPLGDLLRPDGSLDLTTGFRGSLDMRGWQLASQPGEAPRFLPLAPGDENWATQFSSYGTSDTVVAMALAGNGDLYIGGNFTSAGGNSANRVARWDGSAWSTLGSAMNGTVRALALDGNGDLYAGGEFSTAGGVSANRIAKWNGSTWSALGSGMNGHVRALVMDGSGNLYAGGDFNNAGGVTANRVARWNGSAWSALGSGVDGTVEALAWDNTGKLYAGGWFTKSGTTSVSRIARWNGSAWVALGSGVNSAVYALALDGSGNLYAGGWFTTAGGVSANYIAKWNGSAWSDLGGGTSAALYSLAVDGAGNVYAGGDFNAAGGISANRIAKWDGSTWSALGSGANSRVEFIIPIGGGRVYAGGSFSLIGGLNANRIALWDGTYWMGLGGGMGAVVYALALDGSGNLYAGGNFLTAGGISANRIAKWDGSRWTPLGAGVNNAVRALAVDGNGNLYAGGDFTVAGGVSVSRIAKWNGSAWSVLGSGVNSNVRALAVDGANNLYVGGDFGTAGGINASRVAKWSGSAWSALGNGVNGTVEALVLDGSGKLYVGGWFTNASGVSASRVARWFGSAWSALGSGVNGIVRSLAVDGNGNLYAGGDFSTAGGNTVNYVAKWNGSAWSALGTGMSAAVNALALDSNGTLYAGGFFTTASGTSASRIARWDGSAWTAMGSGMNNTVRVLRVIKDLYAGGEFITAGGKSSTYIARWAVNDPPTDISLSANHVAENLPAGTVIGTLTASDPNPGDTHTFSLVSTTPCQGVDNAAFTINASQLRSAQAFDYEAKAIYSICVRASDGQGGNYDEAFNVSVDNTNEAPNAADDAYTTLEDSPKIVIAPGVLGNDSDPENDPLTAAVKTQPTHGTLALNTNGSFTYTPHIGYNGSDSFTYYARDSALNDTGTVNLTIEPVNNNVVAVPDSYSTAEDTPLSVPAPGVLDNDYDPDGDPITASPDTPPSHGSLSLYSDGSFLYTPEADYNGTDFFIYQASDGTFTDRATVTITITPQNDPPQAMDNSYATSEDTSLSRSVPGVLGNDSDPDDDPLTASLANPPDHGTLTLNENGSFTYTPAPNYEGPDSFAYTASDGFLSDSATVNLTVNSVNDAPNAVNDSYTTPEDTPLSVPTPGVLGNDNDLDDDPLTATLATPPTHGTLTLDSNGSFTYTPAAGYAGLDSFTYTASDGNLTDSARVNLTVATVNNPPQAANNSYTTAEDTPLSKAAPGVLGNDSDPDGDALTATLKKSPAHGAVTLQKNGSFTYTPAANYHGSDSFTYTASDGALSDTATVNLTLTSVADSPQAANDHYSTSLDTPLNVPAPGVLGNDSDPDGDPLTAAVKTLPAHGTLVLNANGSFTYTPAPGYAGSDSFTYTASDGALTDPATVAIQVNGEPPDDFQVFLPISVNGYPH